jgi:hypothetical protein
MPAIVRPADRTVTGADTALIPARHGADTAMPAHDVVHGAHHAQTVRCSHPEPEGIAS